MGRHYVISYEIMLSTQQLLHNLLADSAVREMKKYCSLLCMQRRQRRLPEQSALWPSNEGLFIQLEDFEVAIAGAEDQGGLVLEKWVVDS